MKYAEYLKEIATLHEKLENGESADKLHEEMIAIAKQGIEMVKSELDKFKTMEPQGNKTSCSCSSHKCGECGCGK